MPPLPLPEADKAQAGPCDMAQNNGEPDVTGGEASESLDRPAESDRDQPPEAAVALDFYCRLNTERWEDANGRVRRGYAFKDLFAEVYRKLKRLKPLPV